MPGIFPMPGIFAEVSHGGHTESVNTGLDTGMGANNASVGYAFADRMGLPRLKQIRSVNGKPIYSSYIDEIKLLTSSGYCTAKDVPIEINPTATKFSDLYEIVLGAPLMEIMGGTVSYGEKGFSLVCGSQSSQPSMIPAILGISAGLVGTWAFAQWYFKK